MSKLANHLDEFASSKDHMRRLVIHRLYEISPEIVCEKEENGTVKTDIEGKYILLDLDKLPSTRLLIMKQFIKQFHWSENVDTAGGAKDKKTKGYNCEVIRQLCENAYLGDYGKMAYEIDENFFKLLGIKSGDSSEQKTADDYIANILATNGSNINVIDQSDIVLWKNIKIIEMADSLEKALFDDSGSTPLKLYFFAIAFYMNVRLSNNNIPSSSEIDCYRDIRKIFILRLLL